MLHILIRTALVIFTTGPEASAGVLPSCSCSHKTKQFSNLPACLPPSADLTPPAETEPPCQVQHVDSIRLVRGGSPEPVNLPNALRIGGAEGPVALLPLLKAQTFAHKIHFKGPNSVPRAP